MDPRAQSQNTRGCEYILCINGFGIAAFIARSGRCLSGDFVVSYIRCHLISKRECPVTKKQDHQQLTVSQSAAAADMAQHAEPAAELLKAMANPHRLQVLCLLEEGEMSVGAINQRIPLSQPALSQHLGVLRADGLVMTRRVAQTIYYRVAPGPTMEVIKVLHSHFCSAVAPDTEHPAN